LFSFSWREYAGIGRRWRDAAADLDFPDPPLCSDIHSFKVKGEIEIQRRFRHAGWVVVGFFAKQNSTSRSRSQLRFAPRFALSGEVLFKMVMTMVMAIAWKVPKSALFKQTVR